MIVHVLRVLPVVVLAFKIVLKCNVRQTDVRRASRKVTRTNVFKEELALAMIESTILPSYSYRATDIRLPCEWH